jgi:ABC-type multidrug transport system fused ATPase/permease subunit
VDNSVGKLIARLSRDAPNVKAALDERLADVLQSLTSFSIGIIAGLLLDWRMAICEICAVSLTLAIQLILLHYLKQRTIADAQIEEEVARIATDAIQNVKTIQTLNRQKYLNKKFADASIVPNRRSIQRGLLEAMTIAVSITTETLNFAIIYTIGAFIISAGYVSPIIAFQ